MTIQHYTVGNMNGLNQGVQFDSTIISRRLVIRLTLPGPVISIGITYTLYLMQTNPFNLRVTTAFLRGFFND